MPEQHHQTRSASLRTSAGPIALGYLRLDPDAPAPTKLIADGIAAMEQTAERCYYTLAEVFVDDDPQRHLGWGSLMDAARTMRPVAVLVPDLAGLRLSAPHLDILRAQLRYVTTAPLVLARPTIILAPSTPPSTAPELSTAPEPADLPMRPRGTTRSTARRALPPTRWTPWRH